jgi:hypothetical protein
MKSRKKAGKRLQFGIFGIDKEDLPGRVGSMDIPGRLRSVIAELEFGLWEAMVNNELFDGDIKFDFAISKEPDVGYQEKVEVTISVRTIRKCP